MFKFKKLLLAGILCFSLSSVTLPVVSASELSDAPKEVIDMLENFSNQKTTSTFSDRSGGSKTVSLYRGSPLAWSRDYVYFEYNGRAVTHSSAWQEAGWIFPNIVRKGGIKRYNTSSWTHSYRAHKTIGAGTPTPWGDVKVYETSVIDYINVYGNGSHN